MERNLSRRKTTEEWIIEFRRVHGTAYGYDKIVDVSSGKTPVTITCAEHGDFQQTPGSHKAGCGCPSCARMKQIGRKGTRPPTAGRAPLNAAIVNERIGSRGLHLVGVYVNTQTPAAFRCSSGHEWTARPGTVLSGAGCPRCAGNLPLSRAEVNRRIASRGLYLSGEYESASKKAEFKCSHGHSWWAVPSSVVHGTGCPNCSGKARHTVESINEKIAARGLRVISPVKNIKTKATFTCSDAHVWETTPNHVLQGSGCPECSNRKPLTAQDVQTRLQGSGIRMIGNYVNTSTRTRFECESKGHKWWTTANSVFAGTRCPTCGQRSPLSQTEVNERVPPGIRMVGPMVNTYTKALFVCDTGHDWHARPADVMRGHGCPHCAGLMKLTAEIVNERIAYRQLKLEGEYISSSKRATFSCAQGHRWEATPGSVLAGAGCSACAERGFNPSKPSTLYYIRITGDDGRRFYKIGITNLTVRKRYGARKMKMISILKEWQHDGLVCQRNERRICRDYKEYRINKKDAPFSDADGYKETFSVDVLKLDSAPTRRTDTAG